MTKRWDILGLGCVAIDDILFISQFPIPDRKMQLTRTERHGGGQTATALVAASRLGGTCAYGGALGRDDLSAHVEADFRGDDIDVSVAVEREDAIPAHAFIIVDEDLGTRTILYELAGWIGADDHHPPEETIHAAGVLFIDDYGVIGNIRAAKIARAAGIPVVADLEHVGEQPHYDEMVSLIDHLIVPLSFAQNYTGATDPAEAAKKLWNADREVVVVTCGETGSWYLSAEYDEPVHQPAYEVDVVDTTGCGDVYHGAYALLLTRDVPLAERVRFAAATAALKATKPGGRLGIPSYDQVQAFLAQQSN